MERVAFIVEETGERITCMLNPEHIVQRRIAGLAPRRSGSGIVAGPARSDSPLLHTGGGRTEIELQLLFDVDLLPPPDRPATAVARPGSRRRRAPGELETRTELGLGRAGLGPTPTPIAPPRPPRRRRPPRTSAITRGRCGSSPRTRPKGGRGVPHVRIVLGKEMERARRRRGARRAVRAVRRERHAEAILAQHAPRSCARPEPARAGDSRARHDPRMPRPLRRRPPRPQRSTRSSAPARRRTAARRRRRDAPRDRRPLLRRPFGAVALDRRCQPARRRHLARGRPRPHHPARAGRPADGRAAMTDAAAVAALGPHRVPGVTLRIDGDELDAVGVALLAGIRVRREASAPAACAITFEDPADAAALEGILALGAAVEASVEGFSDALFTGEIVSVEQAFGADGTLQVTARCQDAAHRLRADSQLRVFVDVSVVRARPRARLGRRARCRRARRGAAHPAARAGRPVRPRPADLGHPPRGAVVAGRPVGQHARALRRRRCGRRGRPSSTARRSCRRPSRRARWRTGRAGA